MLLSPQLRYEKIEAGSGICRAPFAANRQEVEMEKKPRRKTPERIMAASLTLFNEHGEPNVTMAAIADELNISPGNLYYHYRDKEQIVNALFAEFKREMEELTDNTFEPPISVEDMWLFLHLLFEKIWIYRFLYRDLVDLLSRYRILASQFKQVLGLDARLIAELCQGLVEAGEMQASVGQIQSLAVNMTVIATYWLSFAFVRNPRGKMDSDELSSGVYQVMSLLTPFLCEEARQHVEQVSLQYVEP